MEAALPIGTAVAAKPAIKLTKKATLPAQSPLNATQGGQQEYEVITEEPINEAELDIESSEPFNLMPYAVHDFSEELEPVAITPRVQSSKSHGNQFKRKHAKNMRRSMSDSGKDAVHGQKNSEKPVKPPKISLKPAKPAIATTSLQAGSQAGSQVTSTEFLGAYSELDMKTSYATLEPHIGEKGEVVPMSEQNVKEKYSHLNR